MTYFIASTGRASDADLAGQAMPVEEPDDFDAPSAEELTVEADAADVIEQHCSVPSADDDYDR